MEMPDRVPSLVDCAAQAIVCHSSLAESIIHSYRLPPNVIYRLMKVSFVKGRILSLKALLPHWPYERLAMDMFWPELRECIRWKLLCGCDTRDILDCMRSCFVVAMKSFFFLFHSEKRPSKFTLDISGVDLSEVQILSAMMYLKKLTSSKKHSRKHHSKSADSVGPYTLFMDCSISDVNVNLINLIHELVKPFKNKLIVEFKRLEIVSVPWRKVLRILHSLNEKVVTSLSINMNGPIIGEHFISSLKRVGSFKNLTSLSLSQNHIKLNNKNAEILGAVLQKCKFVNRLNLSGNPVTGSLETILARKEMGIIHLNLSYCNLSSVDINYLANSLHRESIVELDLSYNDLNKSFSQFLSIINGASCQLEILCIDYTHLRSHHIGSLVTALCQMKRLRYLSMPQTHFGFEEMMELAPLGSIKSLEIFRPCSNLDDDYFEFTTEVDAFKENFLLEYYKFRKSKHKNAYPKETNILF
ncbi:leucine-rich repeat-containing protein 14B-like [Ischnura elegans]|uniref:leucine-rich repeat-containing protein 14B-like n=1 Tax=Ischnura elegans TaxID=197161 RepID=UPI001ED88E2D|nr:leucine-rich repeat-containing protein 14B-like [Ischnura elegans]